MLATVIDQLYSLQRLVVAQTAKSRSDVPKLVRWPRPNTEKPKKISLRDLARRLS